MQAHEQRVIDEKKELDKKRAALMAFTGSDDFNRKISEAERVRLTDQARSMHQYSDILSSRINAFPPPRDYGYGNCPRCGAAGVSRERRMNGNDQCANRHVYPSKEAIKC